MDNQLYITFYENHDAECCNIYRCIFIKFTPTVFAQSISQMTNTGLLISQLRTAQRNQAGMERILLLLRMARTRGSNECMVFHCLGRIRALKEPRHAQSIRKEKKRAADNILSSMQKRNRNYKKMSQARQK